MKHFCETEGRYFCIVVAEQIADARERANAARSQLAADTIENHAETPVNDPFITIVTDAAEADVADFTALANKRVPDAKRCADCVLRLACNPPEIPDALPPGPEF